MIDLESADWIIYPPRKIYCAYKNPCDYSVAAATDCMSEHCRTKHKYVDANIKCDVSEDCHFATYDETSLQNHKLHFHLNKRNEVGTVASCICLLTSVVIALTSAI